MQHVTSTSIAIDAQVNSRTCDPLIPSPVVASLDGARPAWEERGHLLATPPSRWPRSSAAPAGAAGPASAAACPAGGREAAPTPQPRQHSARAPRRAPTGRPPSQSRPSTSAPPRPSVVNGKRSAAAPRGRDRQPLPRARCSPPRHPPAGLGNRLPPRPADGGQIAAAAGAGRPRDGAARRLGVSGTGV
jgi:hypothetical protein